jgi:hypothetical protein
MNFVSFEFAAFLAVVYVLHWSCRYAGTRKWLLTIASYVLIALAWASGSACSHRRRDAG